MQINTCRITLSIQRYSTRHIIPNKNSVHVLNSLETTYFMSDEKMHRRNSKNELLFLKAARTYQIIANYFENIISSVAKSLNSDEASLP